MVDSDTKYFVGETDKNPLSYKCGETMTFTITPKSGDKFLSRPDFVFYKWSIEGDDGRRETGSAPANERQPLVLKTSLKKPGFVHITVDACNYSLIPLEGVDKFEGGAGAELDKIELDSMIPTDYDEFWDGVTQISNSVDISTATVTPLNTDKDTTGFDVYKVLIDMPIGRHASGVLSIPENAADKSYPIEMIFRGYGVPRVEVEPKADRISFVADAHGLDPEESDEFFERINESGKGELFDYGFDNFENSDPNTTYFKGMMLRNLVLARFLRTLPQWNGNDFIVSGGSQGAFQSVNVAAHDKLVSAIDIHIPWFCNLGGYKKGKLIGWAPDYAKGICYFDTAVSATRVKCPVSIRARLGDYVCPPSGIVALYHSFNTKKELKFFQNATHGYECPVEMVYEME